MTTHNHHGNTNIELIRKRSEFIHRVRDFFRQENILEIQTPCIQSGANLDHGTNPIQVDDGNHTKYLITSPEHFLKRLLADHPIALGCITPCFRAAENGSKHNPEFTMAEWYQPHWNCEQLQDQVIGLLQTVSGLSLPVERISYRHAFQKYAEIDPMNDTDDTLKEKLDSDTIGCCDTRQDLLDALLLHFVEPRLGRKSWCFLYDYPADQAAQAQQHRDSDGYACAQRFELYWNGIELANGYHENTDSDSIRRVFMHNNPQQLQLDEKFLQALTTGLPPCSGVAVGLDRIFMLCNDLKHIKDALAFSWDQI